MVPKAIWAKLAAPDDANRIPLQTNCLLLDDGSSKILIETGFGSKWTEKERHIYGLQQRTVIDALREVNVDPADIAHVIVTHLHFDHAGALTHLNDAGEAVCSFPNATIHVQQLEWEDALANKSTMTRTYLRNHLDPIREQINCVEGQAQPVAGITVWPMPGHTWGQQAVRFQDDQGVVCFPGDVLPTVNHVHAAFSMGYDMEPYTNMLSKNALLERAVTEGWRLALDHEPGPAVVRVMQDPERPGRYALEPVA